MTIREAREKVNDGGNVRVKVMALFCVTVIAVLALLKMADPENILINIIVCIGSFLGGEESARRRMDTMPPNSSRTETMTESKG